MKLTGAELMNGNRTELRLFQRSPLQKQRGVALMMVIFIFALVSILSVGMYNRQSLFVQTAGNVLAQTQAYQYALASEMYGRWILKDDWDNDKKDNKFVDDLVLMENSTVLPIDSAFIEAQFNDLQGRLNLNDLLEVDGVTVNATMKQRFINLFKVLEIESVKVEMLTDWIDENQTPDDLDGVEDGEYLSLDPPYSTAGQPFRHISELRLLLNISSADYENLLPHVSVLPQGFGNINVNTATSEVIQSLSDKIDESQAKSLIETRANAPWETVESFKSDPVAASAITDFEYLGVKSDFFEIATKITLSDRKATLVSVVYRDTTDGKIQVISRDQGQNSLIDKEPKQI